MSASVDALAIHTLVSIRSFMKDQCKHSNRYLTQPTPRQKDVEHSQWWYKFITEPHKKELVLIIAETDTKRAPQFDERVGESMQIAHLFFLWI